MTIDVPVLDARTFEALMAELRRRIVRYAPEWTDVNPSDPGVTLVELFAWLTETMLFQLNQVPDLTYLKFLELIGLSQAPAAPALADVTFTPAAGAAVAPVIPARTQVAATGPDGSPAVFETDDEMTLVRWALTDLLVDDGAALTPVTAANADGNGTFRPLGWVPRPGNALYLGFAPPDGGGVVDFPAEVRLHVTLPAAALAGMPVNAAEAAKPPAPPARIAWEVLPAAGARWRRVDVFADGSLAFSREGYVQLAGPRGVSPATLPGAPGQPVQRYWLRARLVDGAYPNGHEPELDAVVANTVTARNLATVTDELLGVAEGHPGELFTLLHHPVAPGTLTVEVRPDQITAEVWSAVGDFLASSPDDAVFTVDADLGVLTFGDGRRGRVLPAGAEVVSTAYRWGGGDGGNVPAGAISQLLSGLSGVDSVTNARPAAGGTARQPLAELRAEAPARLRNQGRGVTAADYAQLARDVGGVADAAAIPLAHPDHPGTEVAGTVTVAVVADTGGDLPAPSGDLLASVARFLEPRRMLATELFVRGPRFVPVDVHATLAVDPSAAPGAVARAAEAALRADLAPVRTGAGGQAQARFGQPLFASELYRALLSAPSVQAVTALALVVDGRPHGLDTPVAVPPDGLLTNGTHRLDIVLAGS